MMKLIGDMMSQNPPLTMLLALFLAFAFAISDDLPSSPQGSPHDAD